MLGAPHADERAGGGSVRQQRRDERLEHRLRMARQLSRHRVAASAQAGQEVAVTELGPARSMVAALEVGRLFECSQQQTVLERREEADAGPTAADPCG